uniref:Protein CASC3 n=1 Tax=Petromyzon marinus TaxID=7757 RepID=S4RJY0_PETMA
KNSKRDEEEEDQKNPAFVPRKGLFFEHDIRGGNNKEDARRRRRRRRAKVHNRKLWRDAGRWEHDRFREDEQAPKSREELVALYGYDIRSGAHADDARPLRRPRDQPPGTPAARDGARSSPQRHQQRHQ